MDLCNILGNMLDNSIEACEKCEPSNRIIICDITDDGQRVMITVKNAIDTSVLYINPSLDTTKLEKEIHGFGVKTIKAIAEKYNGYVYFYEEDLTFVCKVIMYK